MLVYALDRVRSPDDRVDLKRLRVVRLATTMSAAPGADLSGDVIQDMASEPKTQIREAMV